MTEITVGTKVRPVGNEMIVGEVVMVLGNDGEQGYAVRWDETHGTNDCAYALPGSIEPVPVIEVSPEPTGLTDEQKHHLHYLATRARDASFTYGAFEDSADANVRRASRNEVKQTRDELRRYIDSL